LGPQDRIELERCWPAPAPASRIARSQHFIQGSGGLSRTTAIDSDSPVVRVQVVRFYFYGHDAPIIVAGDLAPVPFGVNH